MLQLKNIMGNYGMKEIFIFDNYMSLYFLVINLDKNQDRYDLISKSLSELNCVFERVRAINGYDMSNDEYAKKLPLSKELFNR